MNALFIGLDRSLCDPRTDYALNTKARESYLAQFFDHYAVLILTPKQPGLAPVVRTSGMAIYATLSQSYATMIPDAVRIGLEIHRECPLNLITVQDPLLTGLAGYFLKKRLNIPLHVQIHADYLDNPFWLQESALNRWYNRLGKAVLRKANAVTAVHPDIAAKIRAIIKIPTIPVTNLPYGLGIDTRFFLGPAEPDFRSLWLAQRFRRVIFFAGRLSLQKNLAELIRAIPIILQRFPKTLFVLAGEGDQKNSLLALARELGIEDHVHSAGFISDIRMPSAYQSSDIVVLPSFYEGHARTLMEAGVSGVPIVSTPVTGTKDIIQGAFNGRVATSFKALDLAAALMDILANHQHYHTNAQSLKHSLAQQFDYRCNIADWAKQIQHTTMPYDHEFVANTLR